MGERNNKSNQSRHWSQLFIYEPVWAVVLAAFIVLLGTRSLFELQVRKFPDVQQGVITISSGYAGAPSHLMQSAVTKPLSRAISQADGIDFIESETRDSYSQIRAFLKVNYPIDKAFTDILSQIQSAKKELPSDIEDPEIVKGTGNSIALLYVAYTSEGVNPSLIYNYLNNIIRPQLSTLSGVGKIDILGAQPPAMRIWLDLAKMQEFAIDVQEVNYALSKENFLIPSGKFKNLLTESSIILETQGRSIEDFESIVVRSGDGSNVYLSDIARVEFGATSYDAEVIFNDKPGVFLAVDMLPAANALTVIKDVRAYLDKIEPSLPQELNQSIVYDATTFIQESINEVIKTTFEAVIIVLVVMYLFLKSHRAVFISVIAIPLSILGVAVLMQVVGFSINLLTLLAMILAIGLVIDDAIIVVENCSRYIEAGDKPIVAAKKGIKEIARPIITMTLTLAVAYSPMIFLDGLVGGLFREFAFTLAGSVLVSGVIALSLSPMMCAYLLKPNVNQVPRWLINATAGYQERLKGFFRVKGFVVIFCILLMFSNVALYKSLSSDLAPKEDQGFAMVAYNAPLSNNLSLVSKKSEQIKSVLNSFDEKEDYFIVNGMGSPQQGFGGFVAQPMNLRERSMEALERPFREKFSKVIGLEVFSFTPNSLPGVDGLPFQLVIYGPYSYDTLYLKAKSLQETLLNSGYFPFITTNIKLNKPEAHLVFDELRLSDAGLSSRDLALSLLQVLADNASGKFDWLEDQFDVIVRSNQISMQDVFHHLPVKAKNGENMGLSQFATMQYQVGPNMRYQFNQLNAIVLQGMYFPLFTQSDVLGALDESISQLNDEGYFVDYLGQTRTYVQESQGLIMAFGFALVVIYLILSAQFRSFVDPWIILLTVPLAVSGTLAVMNISSMIPMGNEALKYLDVNLNIYTQLGLLTLIGLITKHGVLIVEFANEKMHEGKDSMNAALEAAHARFRPILMTTATMVAGVMPLIFASGSGAVSRLHIGVVIISGLIVGTLFTLFIIPVIYDVVKSRTPEEDDD